MVRDADGTVLGAEAAREQYRSDNFVIEYIEEAPCWVELVQGVRGPRISESIGYKYNRAATGRWW